MLSSQKLYIHQIASKESIAEAVVVEEMGKQKKKTPQLKGEQTEKGLDRFAGSSEEEAEESSDDNNDESDVEKEPLKESKWDEGQEEESDDGKDEESMSDDIEGGSRDDEDEVMFASGMANAMSRILGTTSKAGNASVVLSKTTTPLQRMALKEKEHEKEVREKRRANKERNLAALHVPLSVATTLTGVDGSSGTVGKELEQERAHRRVATRGVVALFNAIAQHQKKNEVQESVQSSSKFKTKEEVKKMSKHGFLDMIKTAAAAKTKEEEVKPTKDSTRAPKWNALQDNYMLNSKLKDWDKESSDEGENEEVNEDWSDEEGGPASKKRRASVQ